MMETKSSSTVTPLEVEPYTPKFDYDDPFLRHAHREISSSKKPSKPSALAIVAKANPVQINWPAISYHGVIENNYSGTQVALLQINNKKHLVSRNEVIGEMEVRSFNTDSAVLAFHDQLKSFKKSPN